MNKKVESKIKALKGILPDADFVRLSRGSILSAPQIQGTLFSVSNEPETRMSFLYSLAFGLSVTTAIVLMVILMGGVDGPRAALAIRDLSEIEAEAPIIANEMNTAMNHSKEMDTSQAAVTMALAEASSDTEPPPDSPDSIESINHNPESQQNVDDLLKEALL